MGKLPSSLTRRTSCLLSTSSTTGASRTILPNAHAGQQIRHATFIPRPRRPYQFTQLVQLSDGSTFTVRTTSPAPLHKSAKDTRNHILWQPTEKSLKNVELDEAGKLAAFRERFGRGFDMAQDPDAEDQTGKEGHQSSGGDLDLGDLISGYAEKENDDQKAMLYPKKPQFTPKAKK